MHRSMPDTTHRVAVLQGKPHTELNWRPPSRLEQLWFNHSHHVPCMYMLVVWLITISTHLELFLAPAVLQNFLRRFQSVCCAQAKSCGNDNEWLRRYCLKANLLFGYPNPGQIDLQHVLRCSRRGWSPSIQDAITDAKPAPSRQRMRTQQHPTSCSTSWWMVPIEGQGAHSRRSP